MTILSAQSIKKREGLISPFHEKTNFNGVSFGLSSHGYDIRIAETIVLESKQFCLASSMELFNMPTDLMARVCDKSTWIRLGLHVHNTVIESGWRGYLTIELVNNSNERIIVKSGSGIAQIIFEELDEPTDRPYTGKYQDQRPGVQEAIFVQH